MSAKNTTSSNHEKKFWDMTRFERIMALLTLLGLVIAGLTGFIFWYQLDEMRTDERAWISVSTKVAFPKDENSMKTVPVVATITYNNIGKTAARGIKVEAVVDYEMNGESPDFVYDGRPRSRSTTGIIFPNDPQQLPAPFLEGDPSSKTEVKNRYLVHSEFQDLNDGTSYMVVYVKADYTDIFGKKHWTHYCSFFINPNAPPVNISAKACTSYNDTDNE